MVPTFDKFMFPILDWLTDNAIRRNRDIQEKMKEVFHITEDDMKETISRGIPRFNSNVNWALTFLYQAGLTIKPKTGYHQISETGRKYLAEGITEITEKELVKRFGSHSPKFFFSNKNGEADIFDATKNDKEDEPAKQQSPEEAIHEATRKLEEALIGELLELVKKVTPADFEKLVVQLLVKMGYGGSMEDAASVTKMSGDEGIDGVIKEDVLGLDSIYLQAKHYTKGPVGRPELQAFVGALSPKHAKKGVFITTSTFTQQAIDYAKAAEARIILIDGHQLCKYMLLFNLGVSTREVIEIKSIDSDYFNFD